MTMTPKRLTQPIVQYDFTCHGAGVASSFPDSTGNNLLGPVVLSSSSSSSMENPFRCDDDVGTGIKPKEGQQNMVRPFVSEESSKKLIDHFLQKQQQHQQKPKIQLTAELWFTPSPKDDIVGYGAPIVSISGLEGMYAEWRPDAQCALGNDFQILQQNTKQEDINMWLFAAHHLGCQYQAYLKPKNKFTAGALTQLIYQIDGGREKFYVNGIELVDYEQRATLNMTAWDPTLRLNFFPDHSSRYSIFTGSVQRFAIYDRSLPSIEDSYRNGLEELEDQTKPRFAPSTIDDGMIPEDVDGLPNKLEPVFNSNLKLFQADVVTTNFELKGRSDISPSNSNGWWDLKAKIISVPTIGHLSTINDDNDKDNNKTLVQVNDTLDVMWEPEESVYKVPLRYTLEDPNYFNVPRYGNSTTLESFSFRFVAVDRKTGGDLAWSRGMEPKIKVQHVDKQPALVVSGGTKFKRGKKGDEKAYLEGDVQLNMGEDLMDLNQVRVLMKTKEIRIHLLNLTESIHTPEACKSYNIWQCSKKFDGLELDFLAYPKEIPDILREGLDFRGPDSGNITITIYHGQGGQCPSRNWKLGANELYGNPPCYNATATISIEKGERPTIEQQQGKYADKAIGAVLSVVLFCILSLLVKCCINRRKALNSKQVVGDEENEEDIVEDEENKEDIEEAWLEVARQEQENESLQQENEILKQKILELQNQSAQHDQQQQEPTS